MTSTVATAAAVAPSEGGTEAHIALTERYAAHNYHPLPVVLAKGEGAWVTDVEGRRYLDCLAGYSALNFGHAHPRLVACAQEQLGRLTLTSRAFYNDQLGPFARDLAAAGGAGIITPDLTPDEAGSWVEASDAHGLDRIFLVSPSSSDERLTRTVAACRGWVYATSVMGVTGARAQTSSLAPELVARIRATVPDAPIGVGLGVSNGLQAREVTEFADAVIVGSALVKALLEAEDAGTPSDLSRLRAVVADLSAGVRTGSALARSAG